MATQLQKFCKFLNTDVGKLWKATEATAVSSETVKSLFEVSTALGVMCLHPALISGLSFVAIAAQWLKIYHDKTKEEPTLEDCVAIAAQLAYVESFRVILALPQNQPLLNKIAQTKVSESLKKQIDKLGEFKLNEQQARKALLCFHESELAKVFNPILVALLQEAGLDDLEAAIFTERVSRSTPQYINQALAGAGDSVRSAALYSDGWRKELDKYQSIDDYLEEQISQKPLEPVFAENFCFKDIYIPLKVKRVNKKGQVDKRATPQDLEQWAKEMLQKHKKPDCIIFIQGGPGRGKSVFCRMFADWVRQNLHPIWTPILIRLRDIRTFERSLENTLRAAVKARFAASDDSWLMERNTRYLFLLDGFDELLMERGTGGGLEEFLKQVGRFQQDCKQFKEMGHRVLITGRSLALHNIERFIPANLERVELMPMDEELQQQWLSKWAAQVGRDKTSAFHQFLQDPRCPDRVRELAQEPLLLYLLAAMHRDGQLTDDMFEEATGVSAKILIYQEAIDWVLNQQRPAWLNRNLTEIETFGLQRILAEAGLCVAQSGGECAAIAMLEERLQDNESATDLIQKARERLGSDALKNALAAFYLQPAVDGKEGAVEFAHKSFGEFLCAERLKESLENQGVEGEELYTKKAQLDWELYDLLGYGGLTPEIVEYLIALLDASDDFRPLLLFKRLENFYWRWCEGEFIDAVAENYPYKKMRLLRGQNIHLGLRQVDACTGLNVMILLFELHRYAQNKDDLKDEIAFYPCGQKGREGFDEKRILRIIGYSHCLGDTGFVETVGQFLRGANLSNSNLRGAYLNRADLSKADLSYAFFSGANLGGAKLYGANLSETDFSRTTLKGANLTGANLRGADLKNLSWDSSTKWQGVRGLETAVNVPEALKQQLGLT